MSDKLERLKKRIQKDKESALMLMDPEELKARAEDPLVFDSMKELGIDPLNPPDPVVNDSQRDFTDEALKEQQKRALKESRTQPSSVNKQVINQPDSSAIQVSGEFTEPVSSAELARQGLQDALIAGDFTKAREAIDTINLMSDDFESRFLALGLGDKMAEQRGAIPGERFSSLKERISKQKEPAVELLESLARRRRSSREDEKLAIDKAAKAVDLAKARADIAGKDKSSIDKLKRNLNKEYDNLIKRLKETERGSETEVRINQRLDEIENQIDRINLRVK